MGYRLAYQEETPANVCKTAGSRLKEHEVGEGASRKGESGSLGSQMVGEQFSGDDKAADVDADTIKGDVHV